MKDRLGSITGRITIEGKAALNLEVALLSQPRRIKKDAIATTKTGEDGRYRLAEVPSGFYWLKVHAPRYVNAINWDDEGPGRNISVADNSVVQNADLDLVPGGVITGCVTDAEGNPIVGEYVELTILDVLGPDDQTLDFIGEEYDFRTDSTGAYRIYGIPQGRYLVSMGVNVPKVTGTARDILRPSPLFSGRVFDDHYFEQTFCPGVHDRSQARVIEISAGSEVPDVNLKVGKVFRAYAASGRVIDAETRSPIVNCYIQLGHKARYGGYGSSYSVGGQSDTDQDGNFRVEGLLPGRFFVCAQVGVQFEGETDFYCDPIKFEIKDNDVNGLEIKAVRGLTISGNVVVEPPVEEATPKLVQLTLNTQSAENDAGVHDSRNAGVKSDGSFTTRGLRPGPVSISLGWQDASKYFSMIRIEYPGPSGITNAIPEFSLSHAWNAASLPLGEKGLEGVRIVLSYKNGRIRGRVTVSVGTLDSDTRLQAGISHRQEKGQWSTSTDIDVNGNFLFDGLEPGAYEILVYGGIINEERDLSETKTVAVNKDSETEISFDIDLTAKTVNG